MNKSLRTTVTIAALAACAWQPAAAADQSLEFKLVTRALEVKALDAKNIDGQSIGVAKAHGVAYFKDGRIASKDFVSSWDYSKGAGSILGYSTYTFEDGSTITARFTGSRRASGEVQGQYTVLSGTGAFAGAQGTGTFESVAAKLPDATLYNGKFKLAMP